MIINIMMHYYYNKDELDAKDDIKLHGNRDAMLNFDIQNAFITI